MNALRLAVSIRTSFQITFRGRDIFTERNCLRYLVCGEIDFDQLRSAFDDLPHFRRRRIENPKIVLIVDHDALYTNEMRFGRTRLATTSPSYGEFVPFVIWERTRLAVNNFGDGKGMIRPTNTES
jgi:hypothetical protein